MLQLFEAGLPIPRTYFYSVFGVFSVAHRSQSFIPTDLPTSYMSFYIHLTSIHPFFHHRISKPNNATNGMQQTNKSPLDESSLKLQALASRHTQVDRFS